MNTLNIGINCGEFLKVFNVQEAIENLKSCGVERLDFPLSETLLGQTDEEIKAYCEGVKQACDSAQMTVHQTHAPYYSWIDPELYLTKTYLDRYIQSIKATAWLGAKYVVIHPIMVREGKDAFYTLEDSFALNISYNQTFFEKLKPYALAYGVEIAIENMCGTNALRYRGIPSATSSAEKLNYLLERLGEGFCVCLDTGHAFYSAEDPAHFVRKLGKRLKVLHVHDNDGRLDLHIPPTFGYINWDNFCKALAEVRFEGVFSLEVNFPQEPELLMPFTRLQCAIARNLTEKSTQAGGEDNV